ncbi:MAG TPA: (Fe-S)-binding protein [Candidatus Acidoferrales bacterium]|nr:(Fe-S)-binding protein [Candidatus Acidoferrales bacterium]
MQIRVFLFVPCYIDQFFPNVAESTLRILKHLGCEVIFPEDQTCCGQPAYNSGYFEEARLMAMHEVNAFLRFKSSIEGKNIEFDVQRDYIVGPSGSCVAMMRNFYPALLSDDSQFADTIGKFTSRTFEFTEFINRVIKVDNFRGRMNAVVSYHDSCHSLRELGLREEARNILKRIDGLKLVELPYSDVCCGFGGTFAVKFPEISTAMADEKLKHLDSTRADILVSGDMSCLMHLQGRAKRIGMSQRFAHISEIMSESIK